MPHEQKINLDNDSINFSDIHISADKEKRSEVGISKDGIKVSYTIKD